jgi:hypothetical protein
MYRCHLFCILDDTPRVAAAIFVTEYNSLKQWQPIEEFCKLNLKCYGWSKDKADTLFPNVMYNFNTPLNRTIKDY